ncbi:hypothetical protein [Mycobacterium leprae]|uniref:hypothetical protein n=1 Tax=Mycobacterium leprae TaxID=1769 RepID=UPI0006741450|nr:hypothetical protein [Mycobacterium leprae]OAR20047.1 hypothetical protein A8144_12660 [Mycobacterium leprae 3125609]OAX70379.1 hypothetical protein A3216_12230 [Mycobacterium leprae 7935681]
MRISPHHEHFSAYREHLVGTMVPNTTGWHNLVYRKNLAHQITSIFDVVLCWLALGVLVAVVITGHIIGQRMRHQ